MKLSFNRLAIVALLLSTLMPATVLSQEARHGKIVEIRAIENKGDDTSAEHKRAENIGSSLGTVGGMLGSLGLGNSKAGRKLGAAGIAAAPAIGMVGGEYLGKKIAGKIVDVGPSKRYVLKIKFDDGTTVAVARPSEEVSGMQKGDAVNVTGSGSAMKVSAA